MLFVGELVRPSISKPVSASPYRHRHAGLFGLSVTLLLSAMIPMVVPDQSTTAIRCGSMVCMASPKMSAPRINPLGTLCSRVGPPAGLPPPRLAAPVCTRNRKPNNVRRPLVPNNMCVLRYHSTAVNTEIQSCRHYFWLYILDTRLYVTVSSRA